MKKKLTKDEKKLIKSRRLYKIKIGHLAYKTSRGDVVAEAKLEQELKNNPVAKQILEKIIRTNTLNKYGSNSQQTKIKSIGMPNYGNAFRLYSGGSPGLGKKS
ncbi:hypothetical protein [Rheinheimera sp.]|uniref:hypothetical protein n=1 Tax=Rheinheimera sp. TaxID=1869214 RepID=UPI00307D2C84